jgi:hypothetical protein
MKRNETHCLIQKRWCKFDVSASFVVASPMTARNETVIDENPGFTGCLILVFFFEFIVHGQFCNGHDQSLLEVSPKVKPFRLRCPWWGISVTIEESPLMSLLFLKDLSLLATGKMVCATA